MTENEVYRALANQDGKYVIVTYADGTQKSGYLDRAKYVQGSVPILCRTKKWDKRVGDFIEQGVIGVFKETPDSPTKKIVSIQIDGQMRGGEIIDKITHKLCKFQEEQCIEANVIIASKDFLDTLQRGNQMLSLENAEPIPYSTLMGIKIIEDPSMDGVDFSVGYVQ